MLTMKRISAIPITLLAIVLTFTAAAYLHGNTLLNKTTLETPPPSNPDVLDFDAAVQRTLSQSMNLEISEHEIHVKEGQLKQAGLLPNPVFTYDVETSEKGWDARQELYTLSQTVDLAGKRQKRKQAASYEYYAALAGYELAKIERLNQLAKAFIRVAAAQEFLKNAIDQEKNSDDYLKLTIEKVQAGKATLFEQNKAELTKSMADLTVKKSIASLKTAKKSLALVWSRSDLDFKEVLFSFFEIIPPPPLEDYLSKVCEQPEVVRSLYKYSAAYHNLQMEKATRIPDVTFNVGYSYDAGDNGLVAGIALPLPIWDQNYGNIKKARYEMLKTGSEKKQLWLFLEAKLTNAYTEYVQAYEDAKNLKDSILKKSNETFDLALEGYKQGKLEYLEVLEAKRTLFDNTEKYIQALVNYHNKQAEIEYLNTLTD